VKNLLASVLLFLAGTVGAATVSINQFSGLNTDEAALVLADGQSPDSENVITDEGNGLSGRLGFIQKSTEPSTAMWQFPRPDGTRYFITRSGNLLKAATDGQNFNITVATLSALAPTIGAAPLGDNFFFVNVIDGLKYWDGTLGGGITTVDSTMLADKMAVFKDRLVIAGHTANPRYLYVSKYTDGTTFTVPASPSDDDAALIPVSGSLAEGIQGIYGTFQDKLIVFLRSSFAGLYGSRRSNFSLRTFSDNIGLSSPESVQDCDGALRWLSAGRDVWEFNGSSYQKISEVIDDELDSIAQGDAASRSISITTKADFDSGSVSGNQSTAVSPGDLTQLTTTFTQTSTADWVAHASDWSILVDTMTAGELRLSVPDDFATFRTGSSGTKAFWHQNDGVVTSISSGRLFFEHYALGSVVTQQPVAALAPGTTFQITVVDVDGGSGSTGGGPYYLDGYFEFAVSSRPTAAGQPPHTLAHSIAVRMHQNDSTYGTGVFRLNNVYVGGVEQTGLLATPTVSSAQDLIVYIWVSTTQYSISATRVGVDSSPLLVKQGTHGLDSADLYVYLNKPTATQVTATVDDFTVYPVTATVISPAMDTGIALPIWSAASSSYTVNAGTVTLTAQASADGSTSWSNETAVSTGATPALPGRRYVRGVARLGLFGIGSSPVLLDYGFTAGSSGTYTSQGISVGSGVSSWGPVVVSSTLAGGSVIVQFNASTESVVALFNQGTWQTVNNGEVPTVATAPFAAFRAIMSAPTATTTAKVSELAMNWTEGSLVRAASAWTNQRYWLAVAVSSTSNNRVYVYDREGQWQRYTGINASVMGIYDSRFHFANTSGIFQGETGYTDAGQPIAAFYRTKTIAPAGLDIFAKYRHLYLTAEESEAEMETTFRTNEWEEIDLGTVVMNETQGLQTLKLPFSVESVQQSRFIDFKWAVTGSTFWRLLNANLYFDPEPMPE
jgi:hypothetical protein